MESEDEITSAKRQKIDQSSQLENDKAVVLFNEGLALYWKQDSINDDAISLLEKSVLLNYPPSFLLLAIIYSQLQEEEQANKYRELSISYKDWFKQQALSEDPIFQFHLAMYYEKIENNFSKVWDWLNKSAGQGYEEASYHLGFLLLHGIGFEKDEDEAYNYLLSASEQGSVRATYLIGWYYEKVIKNGSAGYWYKKAAEQGHVEAQWKVGCSYHNGDIQPEEILDFDDNEDTEYIISQRFCSSESCEKAFYWYKRAAEKGHAKAMFELGGCYFRGMGTQSNLNEAVVWYHKAADKGYSPAQWTLGDMYLLGKGFQRNFSSAVEWYRKSADQGDKEGQFRLGKCYYWGMGTKQDYKAAVGWLQKAVDQQQSEAKLILGLCYEYAEGVEQDVNKAERLLKETAEELCGVWGVYETEAEREYRRIREVNRVQHCSKEEDEGVDWKDQ